VENLKNEQQKQEIEKKKEYLKSYLPKQKAAERIGEDIERFRQAKMYPSISYDGLPHGNEHHDLSDYIVALENLISKLMKARYERVQVYTNILNQIELMQDETEKELLKFRYLRGLQWDDICIELGFEWAQVHRIHKKALEHFNCE
jgi:DNA-directed RNA polymerase specialized sigma subunit